ncbi:MAG: metal-dependent hydrolase [Methanoregula sp.]|uniref:metal-dependent hydrolase n=1 Tax=Methanoregula sp. TaxID=2052170 RepID=UPI0025DF9E88|nr:metal-dependent hydrolase [Methanoregula sp.]MCK9630023.1 metal-dependent hydrolase [Methanoregula sp.]
MFLFAHVFLGAFIGLGFWHLTRDRRALPLCIIGAILPDLLDKSLALLLPAFFGSGRTLGHSLIFFSIAIAAGILIWHYRRTLLGIAFACAIVSHQIIDEMWNVPSTWYYPLMGPFPIFIILDYIGHYFWLEVSNPSEWVFACASLLIIALWYTGLPEHRIPFLTSRGITSACFVSAVLLGIVGVCLFFFGLAAIPHAFVAPTYDPVTNVMAGLVALCGAVVLVKWPGQDRGIQ